MWRGSSMRKTLGPNFFSRPTIDVAKDLLGKSLVRKLGRETISLTINETEAYDGFRDLASHARFGKTARTAPLFSRAGTIYVYFTYGIHWMLNIVCGEVDYPAAVLIRGAGDISGPARLTKALSIDEKLNGRLVGKKTGLWVEDQGFTPRADDVDALPRVGIPYAGAYVGKPWRFVLSKRDFGGRGC
jgi:DNA-3-methyladenine glycosylase